MIKETLLDVMASDSDDAEEREVSDEESSENDSEEESEYDSDDESESSFDELSVGVALELPKRENRGKKYTTLVGEELEKDEQFWGHNTWEEEAVDEDYNCSEGEEEYAYSTDSDFDDPETDKSDEEVDESHLKEAKQKRHGAYVDPALQRSKRTRIAYQKQKVKSAGIEKKKSVRKPTAAAQDLPVDRSMRATTKLKTEAIIQLERRRDMIKTQVAKSASKKPAVKTKVYTQEELMAMALKTEVENTRSLKNLQAWEDEKKKYDDVKKWNYKGNYDIWVCWNSLLSIVTNKPNEPEPEEIKEEDLPPIEEKSLELYMFTSGKVPEYYSRAAEEKERLQTVKKPLCAITGRPAKYRDPLTGNYYSDMTSYRTLRLHASDTENAEMAASLGNVEEIIRELINSE